MSDISLKQITLIHVAKGEIGLSDEEYRALLVERYPGSFTGSCKELSYKEAEDLIEHFKSIGFTIKKKRKKKKTPPNLENILYKGHPMTFMIERLEGDIRWWVHDGPQRFARKIIGKDRPATTREAAKYIEALKGLRRTQQKQREAL